MSTFVLAGATPARHSLASKGLQTFLAPAILAQVAEVSHGSQGQECIAALNICIHLQDVHMCIVKICESEQAVDRKHGVSRDVYLPRQVNQSSSLSMSQAPSIMGFHNARLCPQCHALYIQNQLQDQSVQNCHWVGVIRFLQAWRCDDARVELQSPGFLPRIRTSKVSKQWPLSQNQGVFGPFFWALWSLEAHGSFLFGASP